MRRLTRAGWRRRLEVLLLALLLPALLLAACEAPEPRPQTFVFEGPTMGTGYHVKVVLPELGEERRAELQRAIFLELEEVNALMSTWLEDSELSRLNRYADPAPFPLSEATWEVFDVALEVSRLSGGALDPTVGPLVNAWGFGPGKTIPGHPPSEMTQEELAALRERIGWQKLELLETPPAIRKARADLYSDLSSVAKGYAVDRVALRLRELGVEDFMVEVGGEVRTNGRNGEGRLWRIGVERPEDGPERRFLEVVPLQDRALATSGDYRNYREIDGERYSHLIDPRAGRPISHRLASVSVVHETCTLADAWATALMVLGVEEGLAVAEREGLAALFLKRKGGGFEEIASSAFEEYLASVDG